MFFASVMKYKSLREASLLFPREWRKKDWVQGFLIFWSLRVYDLFLLLYYLEVIKTALFLLKTMCLLYSFIHIYFLFFYIDKWLHFWLLNVFHFHYVMAMLSTKNTVSEFTLATPRTSLFMICYSTLPFPFLFPFSLLLLSSLIFPFSFSAIAAFLKSSFRRPQKPRS